MRFIVAAASILAASVGGIVSVVTFVDVDDAPRRLDAGDLDGDGDIDLFVVAGGAGESANLQVLLNDGGHFSPGWSDTQATNEGALPWDVDLADTNGDGALDVLYVVPTGGAYQRVNDGDASFSAIDFLPVFAPRAEREPADMDGDGDIDIVYYEEDVFGYFGTLEGHDDGGFDFSFYTETTNGLTTVDYARRFEIGDVNGDGLKDAVMASKAGLHFFRGAPHPPGKPLPVWSTAVKFFNTACRDLALADLNGDALPDLVATVPGTDSVVVFLAQPVHTFGGPTLFPAHDKPDAIAAADFDLDGLTDVIVANRADGRISLLYGQGGGELGPPKSFRVGRQPTDIAAADFDGDGDVDLAVSCAAPGNVAILINGTL